MTYSCCNLLEISKNVWAPQKCTWYLSKSSVENKRCLAYPSYYAKCGKNMKNWHKETWLVSTRSSNILIPLNFEHFGNPISIHVSSSVCFFHIRSLPQPSDSGMGKWWSTRSIKGMMANCGEVWPEFWTSLGDRKGISMNFPKSKDINSSMSITKTHQAAFHHQPYPLIFRSESLRFSRSGRLTVSPRDITTMAHFLNLGEFSDVISLLKWYQYRERSQQKLVPFCMRQERVKCSEDFGLLFFRHFAFKNAFNIHGHDGQVVHHEIHGV